MLKLAAGIVFPLLHKYECNLLTEKRKLETSVTNNLLDYRHGFLS